MTAINGTTVSLRSATRDRIAAMDQYGDRFGELVGWKSQPCGTTPLINVRRIANSMLDSNPSLIIRYLDHSGRRIEAHEVKHQEHLIQVDYFKGQNGVAIWLDRRYA